VAGNVYVTNQGDNTVSVSTDGGRTYTTINVGKAPDAVAVSPNGTHLYLTNSDDGTVSVITLTNSV
jgi:YVTN family beta-propeller protein